MPRLDRTLLAAMVLLAPSAGCGSDGPGTSVRVALTYDESLGLDTAEVTLADRTESGPIAHQLLLLLADDVAGKVLTIEVWGRKAAQRTAYGTTTAVPELGKTVAAQLSLTTCTPGCQGDMLMTCNGPAVNCALGCSEDGDAHCLVPGTSNGVDPTVADALNGTTTFSASATFNTDTGEISGAISRPAGTGVTGGIGYFQAPPFGAGGAALGIFAFHNLAVEATGALHFTGARAAVLLVGDTAGISGTIDVTAGRGTRSTPGPGGGGGGSGATPPGGCGPGGTGTRNGSDDGGGGGGGGSESGAPGGGLSLPIVGVGGMPCLPALLEPLQGGSGGGRGGPGNAVIAASGGGGGGALQITAVRALVITGTINAGGGGGDGAASGPDTGGGGGGGSGGALLLEAPSLTIGATAILAANGGGGGGGGGAIRPGDPGSGGGADNVIAPGGFGSESDNGGGTGGARISPPDVGRDGDTNGNAGGGGAGSGRIVLRGRTRTVNGLVSPAPTQTDVKPPQ